MDISEEKLAAARKIGATQTVNGAAEEAAERIRELTGGQGVDVAFEAIGRADTVATAIQAVRDGGRVVLVGLAPAGVTTPVEITPLVRRSVSVIGSFGARMRSDLPEVIKLVASGAVDIGQLVTHRFTLEDTNAAYTALARGEVTGRGIIVVDPALS